MTEFTRPQLEFLPDPHPATILEIGAGRADSLEGRWHATIERIALDPDQSYYGIDIGASSFNDRSGDTTTERDARMRARWNALARSRPDENIHFVQADGRRLPFANESFDRVVASNVFGTGTPEQALPGILLEADRVLNPDGEIIIHDDRIPAFHSLRAWHEWATLYGLQIIREPERPIALQAINRRYGFAAASPGETDPEMLDRWSEIYRGSTIWRFYKGAVTKAPAAELPATIPPASGSVAFHGLRKIFRRKHTKD